MRSSSSIGSFTFNLWHETHLPANKILCLNRFSWQMSKLNFYLFRVNQNPFSLSVIRLFTTLSSTLRCRVRSRCYPLWDPESTLPSVSVIALQSKEPMLPPLSPRKPPVLRDGATPDESLHGFLLFGARRVEVWRLVKCHVQTQISSCSCPSFTSRTGWVIGRWYQVEKMMRLDVGHCQVHPDQVEQQRVESV